MKKTITTLLIAAFLSAGMIKPAHAFEPFVGQIMTVGFNFCPRGWALADGQLLPISSHTALFSLLGTTFGGDGSSTFALPDLRGRSPVHVGSGPGLTPVSWGQKAGSTSFTLTVNQMPSHSHSVLVKKGRGVSTDAAGKFLAESGIYRTVGTPSNNGATLNSATIGNSGGNQSVTKRSPMLGVYYCIALVGLYPSS